MLDTSDGSIFQIVVGAMLVECSVDLTSANYDAINLRGLIDALTVFDVRNDPFELRVAREFLNR